MRTAAQRQRERYWRRKLGLRPITLDLPPDDLARAMVLAGFVLSRDAHNTEKVRRAAGEMVRKVVAHILASRREGNFLPPVAHGANLPTPNNGSTKCTEF